MPPKLPSQLVSIIDLKTGSRLPFQFETAEQWRTFDFISNSQLAVVGTSRDLEIWGIHTGEKERTIEIASVEHQMWMLGVSKNRRFVAIAGPSTHIGVYDLELDQTLFCAPMLPQGARVAAIRWNDDASLLGLACSDRNIRVLNLPLIRQQLAKLNLDWN